MINGARQSAACAEIGISPKTYQRWKHANKLKDQRAGALKHVANKLTEEERQAVLVTANSDEYCDLPPTQIVPKLADKGLYLASESIFYRVLRAANQLTHRGSSRARTNHKPKALVANKPNQVWCWDISYLPTTVRGIFYYLYFIKDIYSRCIVGFSVAERESADIARPLFQKAVAEQAVKPNTLYLHADNGGPMKGATLVETLNKLGVMRSYSRPAVSNDNPYIESVFKTMKYNKRYPTHFETLEAAQQWVSEFVDWYNHEHLHSGIQFVTPASRHAGDDTVILAKRKAVYNNAKASNPSRWARSTRNWEPAKAVILNPDRQVQLPMANPPPVW